MNMRTIWWETCAQRKNYSLNLTIIPELKADTFNGICLLLYLFIIYHHMVINDFFLSLTKTNRGEKKDGKMFSRNKSVLLEIRISQYKFRFVGWEKFKNFHTDFDQNTKKKYKFYKWGDEKFFMSHSSRLYKKMWNGT